MLRVYTKSLACSPILVLSVSGVVSDHESFGGIRGGQRGLSLEKR